MNHPHRRRSEIAQTIRSLLETDLNLDVENPDTNLIETGVLDSLLFVELVVMLETKLGVVVDINEIEFEDFMSVQNICLFVERKLADGDDFTERERA